MDTLVSALRSLNEPTSDDPVERSKACLAALEALTGDGSRSGDVDAAFAELEPLIAGHGSSRVTRSVGSFLAPLLERMVEALFDFPERRLAAYGSLAPGEANHHILDGIEGSWSSGSVRGVRHDTGWGAGLGYPGMRWDPTAEPIEVQLFTSSDLPDHWERIDEFEGEAYGRILVPVETAEGEIVCHLYAVKASEGADVT